MKSAGGGGESAEMMIPPAAPGKGELDHIACVQKNPARRGARRIHSCSLDREVQPAAALGARLRELRWKNSAWLATAETIAGWNGFEIRNAGSGRSPVRNRSG